LLFCSLAFSRRRDLILKDSQEFEIALKIWRPQTRSNQSTPRSIKRFMNRLRRLAIRQRSLIESAPRWREMIAPFARKLGIQQPTPAAEMIPEHAMDIRNSLKSGRPQARH
jgi:hypothetical protein